MRKLMQTSLFHMTLSIVLGTTCALAVKMALDGHVLPTPVIRKYTVLVFTSQSGPLDLSRKGAVGCARAFSIPDAEVVRQFRDIGPDQPIELRFEDDRIIGVAPLPREPAE